MKKVLLILMALILTVGIFSSCGKNSGTQVKVYYKASSTNDLVYEARNLDLGKKTDAESVAKNALKELIKGPKEEGKVPVISKKTKVYSLSVSERVATVNFSEHYLEKADGASVLLRHAIVYTLCGIEGIEGVVIQVEGENLVNKSTGKEFGVLGMGDIANGTEDKVTVKLYFPDKKADGLFVEYRSIDAQNALSLEQIVINELIKGPQSSNLAPSVPQETKLIKLERKDNVCFVNLSGEFVSKTNSGSSATTMALYSVVNSICALRGVDSVQILINGETGVEFGNYVLDIPYEADYSLVK